mmetsp:Transcript_14144/g.39108  ORF Transcript_14144/g.39108 Transcript_14144/m.39108 type:complete len:111 (-) Transcript_14144:675-1007(-)
MYIQYQRGKVRKSSEIRSYKKSFKQRSAEAAKRHSKELHWPMNSSSPIHHGPDISDTSKPLSIDCSSSNTTQEYRVRQMSIAHHQSFIRASPVTDEMMQFQSDCSSYEEV